MEPHPHDQYATSEDPFYHALFVTARIQRIEDLETRKKIASQICEAFASTFGEEKLYDNVHWCNASVDVTDENDLPILIADWNDQNYWSANFNLAWKIFGNTLEKIGCTCDWNDQSTECDGCSKHVETQPSWFGWKPKFKILHGEILCSECCESADPDPDMAEYAGYLRFDGVGSTEVFFASYGELTEVLETNDDEESEESAEGWYYRACFPGCLPDGDPSGPFLTSEDAYNDARDNA